LRLKLHNRIFASSRISAIRERCFAAFGSNHPEPRCFSWRLWVAHDPANNSLAIAQIEIVITAATVLVGANKGERSGDSHATRSEKGSFFEMYTRLRLLVPGPIQILRVPHSRSKSDKNTLTRHWRYDRSLDTVSCSITFNPKSSFGPTSLTGARSTSSDSTFWVKSVVCPWMWTTSPTCSVVPGSSRMVATDRWL